jgi:hypothetical protein
MKAMKQHRRDFLQLFGLSSAAVAAAPALASDDPTVEIINAAAPPQFRSPLPSQFPPAREGFMDVVLDESLWSQLCIEPNTMQDRYILFQNSLGNRDSHGNYTSLAETNMRMAGQLPAPESYCIKQIGFVFSPKTISGLRCAFIDRYVLQLRLGSKSYWEAPLSTVFSVAEPERDAKGFATLPDSSFATLAIPLVIEQALWFSLEVIGKPIHPCGKIIGWGVFKGLHAVGIQ